MTSLQERDSLVLLAKRSSSPEATITYALTALFRTWQQQTGAEVDVDTLIEPLASNWSDLTPRTCTEMTLTPTALRQRTFPPGSKPSLTHERHSLPARRYSPCLRLCSTNS